MGETRGTQRESAKLANCPESFGYGGAATEAAVAVTIAATGFRVSGIECPWVP